MSEQDYYPAGAYNSPDAPYNQRDPEELEFEVCISQTLSKNTTVTTSDYELEGSYLDEDEGGGLDVDIDTSNTDFKSAYTIEHYTPLQLIGKFKEFLETSLRKMEISNEMNRGAKPRRCVKEYQYLIDECSNWVEDETEIVEN